MEHSVLLSELKEKGYEPLIFGKERPARDLLFARLWDPAQTVFDPAALYLGSTSQMPDPETDSEFTFFCCGEPVDFSRYARSPFTLAYFGSAVSQAALFNASLESISRLQEISAGMHLLVNALFSGNGLQYLVDTAAQIFGNPIYVVDLQHKYLAISAGLIPDNAFFTAESQSGYISEKGIASIRANRLDEKVRKSGTAYYYVNELVQKGMLVDAVRIQGIEVGHIMMLESERPFRDFDADFFHRFSNLVSMELQKDSAYTRNKGVMYSYFLSDLLKNPGQDASRIRERLRLLGYNLKDTFYIVAIPPAGHSTSDLQLNVILERLIRIFSGSIYVIYEYTIVFFISRELFQNLSEYEMSQLADYLLANQLKAGISNFFRQLEDMPSFYRQAVDAVKLGLKLNDPSPVYYYSDYYVYKLLETAEQNGENLRFLIHPGLMRLYLYDQEKGTEFIATLREYLHQPGQSSQVAKNLHIHKNTLLYRLGKIRELMGCELAVGEEFMNMNLSMMVLKYLGMM